MLIFRPLFLYYLPRQKSFSRLFFFTWRHQKWKKVFILINSPSKIALYNASQKRDTFLVFAINTAPWRKRRIIFQFNNNFPTNFGSCQHFKYDSFSRSLFSVDSRSLALPFVRQQIVISNVLNVIGMNMIKAQKKEPHIHYETGWMKKKEYQERDMIMSA